MMVFMALFWIAVVGAIIWFVFSLLRQRPWENSNIFNQTKQDPLQIVRTRYAKGKITKKEFEEMKKELTKN